MRISIRSLLTICMLVLAAGCATPRSGGGSSQGASPHYKVGKPYQVSGRWYHPKEDPGYSKTGTASWYGQQFHGRLTANGEIFDMNRMSAAHTTLPLPSMVEVKNLENGRTVVVRVNDRGPFVGDRIIDMSRQAARQLGFEQQGVARVRVRYVGPAPLQGEAPKYAGSRAERQDRVTRAAEAKEPAAASPDAPPETDQISEILTSIESAPAMTPGAEEVAIAEAHNGDEGPGEIPAVDLSTPDPDDARFVDPNASPAGAPQALYIIRVAALSRLDNLDAMRAQLGDIGTLRMSRVETESGAVFYRVNLGPFSSIETAAQSLDAVREAGYADASLVTLTP